MRMMEWMAGLGRKGGASAWVLGAAVGLAQGQVTPEMAHNYVEGLHVHGGSVTSEDNAQARGEVAAYVTGDSLVLSSLVKMCTLMICGNSCRAYSMDRFTFPLPGARGDVPPPTALLRTTKDGRDFTAVVAIARPGNKLHRLEITIKGGKAQVTESEFTLQGPAGTITTLAGLRMDEDREEPGLMAYGTDGLAVRIRENASGRFSNWITVQGSGGYRFTASGPGWAGTSNGILLEYAKRPQGWGLSIVAKVPGGSAVSRVDSASAVFADGSYMVHRAGYWIPGTEAPDPVLGVDIANKVAGTDLHLYKKNELKLRALGDEKSSIVMQNSKGEWVKSTGVIEYEGSGRVVYALSLRDYDRNGEAPQGMVLNGDIAQPLFPGFGKHLPGLGCASTGRCLPGPETYATMVLTPESVTLTMPVLEGTANSTGAPCNEPTFSGEMKTWSTTQRWSTGSAMSVSFGEDVFTVRRGPSLGLSKEPIRKASPASAASAGPVFMGPQGIPVDAAGRSEFP